MTSWPWTVIASISLYIYPSSEKKEKDRYESIILTCNFGELSGYLVTLLLSTWDDKIVHLPFLKDGYELRKQTLGKLLTFKENDAKSTYLSVYWLSSIVSGKIKTI
ncbi:hypothetical protein BRADI_4g03805v3 [Brachypodium distachyon]|uniref:Uncharacterized protein n=1 Tax=Brachypodium distachyon TaxID=15368 RepID=A0A2K2CKB6_BRADI|nr:hypothetical protein BRADI_4g03805v3 [Brachypodium distachyon]PNT62466.1 hypothetical protein BRADI_4g03805v3 [Brachypodium distachyon]